MSDVGKTAQKTAEAVSKQSEQITQSQVFKSVSKVGVSISPVMFIQNALFNFSQV